METAFTNNFDINDLESNLLKDHLAPFLVCRAPDTEKCEI